MKYCKSPFATVVEIDRTIIENFMDIVRKGDTLYFLGDLTFDMNLAQKLFEMLEDNNIHYIVGNHDREPVIKLASEYCVSVSQIKDIKIGSDHDITLCHCAMRV
jgi:calcineurin-like phosphoesterase family protein